MAACPEHERAVRLVEVLVEAQARRGTREEARERDLSHRERVAPQVGAVQLDQVERIEEHAPVVPAIRGVLISRCFRLEKLFYLTRDSAYQRFDAM
jgi:hypothetical protein